MKRTRFIKIFFIVILVCGCSHDRAESSQQVASPKPAAASVWIASFDTVWQTVNENHFDPTFGGIDWNEIHRRYHGQVSNVMDDAAFIELMNKMLGELNLSHYSVFQMTKRFASGSPEISDASVGLDARLLDGRAVITSVNPDSSAAKAGLKPGYVVESIDGISVQQIMADVEAKAIPNENERKKLSNIGDEIRNRFFGDPGTSISLRFLDGAGTPREAALLRKQRAGKKTILDESLPPFYVDFQARRIDDNIGYISFNVFMPPVDERFKQAIDSMLDMRGLIIDIRGNPGGMHEVGEAIVSKLIQKETLFSVFRYRNETKKVIVQPSGKIYAGPVVVLIDGLNASASERFSACIQSIGRAVVIGERSSGSVGPSNVMNLPNGASFMYLVAQSTTPDGTVLEGRGVIPDIIVRLDRESLLAGRDTQLGRAVAYIKNGTH
jgi:carboxyl-terminal processing protease